MEIKESEYTYECIHCGFTSGEEFEYCPECKKNDDGIQLENKTFTIELGTGQENHSETEMTKENTKVITLEERVATSWFGIIIMVFYFLCIFQIIIFSENVFMIIGLSIRIISNAWVRAVAQMLNKNTWLWGTCAFFFPGITLIIISRLPKNISEPIFTESKQEVITKAQNMEERMMDWKE